MAEAAGEEGKPILGFTLGGLGAGMKAAGDYQAVFDLQTRFIEIFRPLGDAYAYYLGMGLLVQGQTALTLGKYGAAHPLLDEALTLARQGGDTYRIALALNYLGDLARCEQNYHQAQAPYEESLALLRDLGAERDVASVLHNLGHTYLQLGAVERAQNCFIESMNIHQTQQNRAGMTECLIGFAAIAVTCGLPAVGARLLAATKALASERAMVMFPALPVDQIDHTGPRPVAPQPGMTAEYGRYLSRTCTECHGTDLNGAPFGPPGKEVPSPNLTPGGEPASWSEEDFFRTMRTGMTPDGHQLDVEMPWMYLAG